MPGMKVGTEGMPLRQHVLQLLSPEETTALNEPQFNLIIYIHTILGPSIFLLPSQEKVNFLPTLVEIGSKPLKNDGAWGGGC